MRRHSTIERFKKISSDQFTYDMKDWLEQAVPFVIDVAHLPATNAEPSEIYKTFRLPFPKLYIDFFCSTLPPGPPMICLLREPVIDTFKTEYGTPVASFVYATIPSDGNAIIAVSDAHIFVDLKTNLLTIGYRSKEFEADEDIEAFELAVRTFSGYITATVMLLNASNTYVHCDAPSLAMNAKRKRRGKAPIPPVHTIRVKKELTRYHYAEDHEAEKRKSPSPHLRRGHFRHYPNKLLWIHPVMIGDAHATEYII